MKETVQLSIGGYAFTFEKDAQEALAAYIGTLESHYLPQEGGREIMDSIEERIAELLAEKSARGAVSLASVQDIIDVIGRPETLEADDPAPSPDPVKTERKLFRDLGNSRLGGVCSGLAQYLGMDVTWMRAFFAIAATVLFFSLADEGTLWMFAVPFLYCVLWVAMPAARTAQDRWAMKGDSGRADDIRRNVQAGIHEMGDTAREVVHSDFFQRFGKWILMLVGIIMLITGTSGLASISVLTIKGGELFGFPFQQMLDELAVQAPVFYDMLATPWIVALVALAVILPFVGILYGGIMLLFGFKTPSWKPGLVIFILWLIDVIVLLVLFFAAAISAEYVHITI